MKQPETDGKVFLTPSQIASRWGLHQESVRRKIRRREIGSVVMGRRRLVRLVEVEQLEREGAVPRLLANRNPKPPAPSNGAADH